MQALVENGKRSVPYAGAFLVKDEEGTDPNIMTSSDSEKSIDDLKGKELLRRLHEVGTLVQVIDYFLRTLNNDLCFRSLALR